MTSLKDREIGEQYEVKQESGMPATFIVQEKYVDDSGTLIIVSQEVSNA